MACSQCMAFNYAGKFSNHLPFLINIKWDKHSERMSGHSHRKCWSHASHVRYVNYSRFIIICLGLFEKHQNNESSGLVGIFLKNPKALIVSITHLKMNSMNGMNPKHAETRSAFLLGNCNRLTSAYETVHMKQGIPVPYYFTSAGLEAAGTDAVFRIWNHIQPQATQY